MSSNPLRPRLRGSHQRVTHNRIADVARGLAGAYYEEAASNSDIFYREWPSQAEFIRRRFRSFIPTARDILIDMLTMPQFPDAMKEEIMEALKKDAAANPPHEHAVKAIREEKLN
jgi:hypothetical protein